MKNVGFLGLIVIGLLGIQALPAQEALWLSGLPEPALPVAVLAAAASSDAAVPNAIRSNKYFLESLRLTNLAQKAFDEGDYDASARYSEEAVRYARLSDEYVALQLKIKETDDAMAAARSRLDWAASAAVNAKTRYPGEYNAAQTAYAEARASRTAEKWDDAIAAAGRVISALASLTEAPPSQPPPPAPSQPPPPPPVTPGPVPLPAQYKVRPWNISKDCFWNISGRPWVYGDPTKWRVLYNANKSRLPQPDNPDLIHPGMILDIPSIKDEPRSDMWDPAKNYPPLR
jgi:nucleoid-associated protein YgaU